MDLKIPHNKPTLGPEEAEAIRRVIESGWIAQGEKVAAFERAVSRYIGGDENGAVAFSNGTTALYMALYVLGIGPGDEVILPTYVCTSLLNAVYMIGATPVIADVNAEDFNLEAEEVEKKITAKTSALIVPHIMGVPADIPELHKLGFPVIEDCATAFGTVLNGSHVGLFGDVSLFSFYASKVITTGQGSMLCSKNPAFIGKARDYREFDVRESYYPRFNFQMTDIQAAMGLVQMNKLNGFLAIRKEIAGRYTGIAKQKGWDYLNTAMPDSCPNWYRFILKLSPGEVSRLKDYLGKNGVRTIIPIEPYELLHRYLKQSATGFPNAEKIAATTLSLPIYPGLKTEPALPVIFDLLEKF